MKLFTFGDSWTEGVGSNLKKENTISNNEEKTLFRNSISWPKYLSELLSIGVCNYGVGAASNKQIFENISKILKTNTIIKGDFVVVMWSSSLRDTVPYFPENEWHLWGKSYIEKQHIFHTFLNKKHSTNPLYNDALNEYKLYFIDNLYSNIYYDYINQNYILFLQFMFQKMGINYLFCDAFDNMISSDICNYIDKTYLINKINYWGFDVTTFKDFLISTKRSDVWEDGKLWINTLGKHPNTNGYKLIAEELYRYIVEHNILIQNSNTKQKII
jgi:lysophospholipase L1-like esterase